MDPFRPKTIALALTVATFLAIRSRKKNSLSPTGAVVGWIVGFLMVSTGLRGMVLFYFYQIGSWATKYKLTAKATLDNAAATTACRGPIQVLAVSIVATVLSLYHAITIGNERPINFNSDNDDYYYVASAVTCAVLAHHATGLADTLASEMGILSKHHAPILITQPWKIVPPGTNGGVTIFGFIWSAVGGAMIGSLTCAMDYISGLYPINIVSVTLFGAICGLLGSVLDSVLGATIQVTYYDDDKKQIIKYERNEPLPQSAKHICGIDILTNEQVNFVSMAITSIIAGWILGPWYFQQ